MNDSFSDRWMRWFEEQNPHLKCNQGVPSTRADCKISLLPQSRYRVPRDVSGIPPAANGSKEDASQAACDPMTLPTADASASISVDRLIRETHALRLRLNMTQRAFAEHLGISSRTYQDWEQGRRLPQGPGSALLRYALKHPPRHPDTGAAAHKATTAYKYL